MMSDLLQPRHRHAFARKLIGALVLVMAAVALDPVPAHVMRLQRIVEPLPEVSVLHWLLIGGTPTVPLPVVNPAGDALPYVLAVGGEIDKRRTLQRLQRRDRRQQLHPVVGGMRFATFQFFLDLTEPQDGAPAAGTRVA